MPKFAQNCPELVFWYIYQKVLKESFPWDALYSLHKILPKHNKKVQKPERIFSPEEKVAQPATASLIKVTHSHHLPYFPSQNLDAKESKFVIIQFDGFLENSKFEVKI